MMIDFHSHILPRMDDGSRSVEESLEMLRRSAEQGVSKVVLTPHFYPQSHTPEHFLDKRSTSFAALNTALTGENGLPELVLGAEVHYFPHMGSSENLREFVIAGTSCILVEMPSAPWTEQMYRELALIWQNLGLTPIIAHVERYFGLFGDRGIPRRLSELPVYVQSNASFFLKSSGKAMKLLRRRQIHVLGSDCHNLTDRAPNLGGAVERIDSCLGNCALDWLDQCGAEILCGREEDFL